MISGDRLFTITPIATHPVKMYFLYDSYVAVVRVCGLCHGI